MSERIEVLVVKPGKAPYPEVIPDSVEAFEEFLGGTVQFGCFLSRRVMLISREDGEGLAPNRRIPGDGRCIRGTFLLCGIPREGNHFVSLGFAQREEFREIFKRPGEFMSVGNMVYDDPDDVADAVYGLWDTMGDGEMTVITRWGGVHAG